MQAAIARATARGPEGSLADRDARKNLTIRLLRRSFSFLRRFMKRYLPFIIVGAIGLVALGGGTMLYRAKRPHLLTIPEDKMVSGKGGTEAMHSRGNPDAPVTLEEFGDFQCPPCASVASFIDELTKEYQPHLRVVFRNFPLAMHKNAGPAALAAEAAVCKGHYWEMHDLLVSRATRLEQRG